MTKSTSVAEIAEKPLYRVTCGDIGTDPEAVEKVCLILLPDQQGSYHKRGQLLTFLVFGDGSPFGQDLGLRFVTLR